MKWIRRPPGNAVPAVGAWIGGGLVLGGAALALLTRIGGPLPTCKLRSWTGYPCVTCGSTRLAESLLAGNIVEALYLNPLVFTILVGLGLWSVASLVRRTFGLPTWTLEFRPAERWALIGLVLALALANWIYLMRNGI